MVRKTIKELLEQPTRVMNDTSKMKYYKSKYQKREIWFSTLSIESIENVSEQVNERKREEKEKSYMYDIYKTYSMYDLMLEIGKGLIDERYEFVELCMKQYVNPLSEMYETYLRKDELVCQKEES